MKINVKYNKSTTFSDIEIGDVFEFRSNFYIKTSRLLTSNVANAVKLIDGVWVYFDESEVVNRVNAELVIKDDETDDDD